jgi:hypothetical protein
VLALHLGEIKPRLNRLRENSSTRSECCFGCNEPRVPHIWPGVGQMWGLTALNRKFSGKTGTLAPAFAYPTSGQHRARYGAPSVRYNQNNTQTE